MASKDGKQHINFGMDQEIYEYLRVMAPLSGMNVNAYLSSIVLSHKADHLREFNQALELRGALRTEAKEISNGK